MDTYFDYLKETDAEWYAFVADNDLITAHKADEHLGMMVYHGDTPLCNYGSSISPEQAIRWFKDEFGTKKRED